MPNVSSPGRARASATSSFTDFTGSDGWTAMTIAFDTTRVTPAKSLNVSYGSLERAKGLIVKLGAMINMVCPSAGARATISAPMAVFAPGRFSTITLCPNARLSGCDRVRATISAAPPGGKGAMIRNARFGNGSAGTEACASNTGATAASRTLTSRMREPCSLLTSSPLCGNGAMIRTGRDGNSCARAAHEKSATSTTLNNFCIRPPLYFNRDYSA